MIVQTKHFKYTYFQPESSLLSFVLDLLSCSHSFGVHCSLADHFKVILDRDMYTDCAGRSTIFTLKKTFQKISLSGRWRDLIDTGERRQKNIKSLEVWEFRKLLSSTDHNFSDAHTGYNVHREAFNEATVISGDLFHEPFNFISIYLSSTNLIY